MEIRDFDPAALAQQYRPLFKLHSEEMFYPCHPEDQLRCANVVSAKDGSVVIPALGGADGSPADQMLCTPLGLAQLAQRGVQLDAATIAALQWLPTSTSHYGAFLPTPDFILRRDDTQFMTPYGFIGSAQFNPQQGTWFHQGAPNNPLNWLGGDPSQYGPTVVAPPVGTIRGAWQEPCTSAWVQCHTVAGVDYVDVIYTAFLAWNGSISFLPGQGEHPNDVETYMVRLKASDLATPVRYFFQQHGGFSWYDPQNVLMENGRVVVHMARQSHELYPLAGRFVRLYGFADDLCDDNGVTWDPPVVFCNRPQGIDSYGVDTDALRMAVSPGAQNDVVLVPLDASDPLWQYVRFRFNARHPDSIAVSDEQFLHQPFPLSTTKWWPEEGPAGTTPPLSLLAAEPGAPGMPTAFFAYASAYLGPDPMPGDAASLLAKMAAVAGHATMDEHISFTERAASNQLPLTISGNDIGGATAAQAPTATFVNWRGVIGAYLLAAVNSKVSDLAVLLPDPLTIPAVVISGVTINDLVVTGLHGLSIAPVAAIGIDMIKLLANTPQLLCTGTVSISGGPQDISLSASISEVALELAMQMITPVALPASSSQQWYVPYVGPLPYSYGTAAYAVTQNVNNAVVNAPAVNYSAIAVDTGNVVLNEVIDLALSAIQKTIEQQASTALADALAPVLKSVFDGTIRIE